MERDVRFFSQSGSPKWVIRVDENTRIVGIGNPLKDERYFSLLSKKLWFSEDLKIEEIMEREQFNTVEKPVMMICVNGEKGDKVFVLKPGYADRQEAIDEILQYLVDRIDHKVMDDISKKEGSSGLA